MTDNNLAAVFLNYTIDRLFPGTVRVATRADEVTFSCECIFPQEVDSHLLRMIEEQLLGDIKAGLTVERVEMMPKNAAELFRHYGQDLLAEHCLEVETPLITLASIGKFYDLWEEDAPLDPSGIRAVKLTGIEVEEGATRIDGAAFGDKAELKAFLKRLKRAGKCSYQKLGPELELFLLDEDDWIWLPRGVAMREILRRWWKQEMQAEGFQLVHSPYDANPFACHQKIFNLHKEHSKPARFAEMREGSDCASLFCTEEKALNSLISFLQFINRIVKMLGLDYHWCRLPSGRGKGIKAEKAASLLSKALEACDLTVSGEGTHLEVRFEDAIGRGWPGPYVEVDTSLRGGAVMLRLAMLGSFDRVIQLLVEKTEGDLPLWLAPEHLRVIPLGAKNREYASELARRAEELGCRVSVDDRDLPLGSRVGSAEKSKVPFIGIVGDNEEKEQNVAVRVQGQQETMTAESLLERLKERD